MAAAVLSVSSPFNMTSQRMAASSPMPPPPAPSSSRSKQTSRLSSSTTSSHVVPPESAIKPSSPPSRPTLLQSLRSATRSKKSVTHVSDDFDPTTVRQGKGKEKEVTDDLPKERSNNMLRRLESKVNFRKSGRDSVTPSPSPLPAPVVEDKPDRKKEGKALPSPKSRPSVPISSSSTSDILVSPVRERSSATRHKSTRSQPVNIPSASMSEMNLSSPPETPRRRIHEQPPSPPETPTPMSRSRHRQLSSSGSPPPSPIMPRNQSPLRARSPSASRPRVVSPSHRGLTSASTSHLPNSASPPPLESPRRPSFSRDQTPSPNLSPRPRPTSPNQRSYYQNRHYNVSSSSLHGPSNPEARELIRTATSMLCKELIKAPAHLSRTEAGMRDWEEVEYRMRALSRMERMWGKSGAASSSTNVNVLPMSSSGLSAAGEDRERKLFADTLRDGFVLCHLINKLRSSTVARPDPREDGFRRTSNITKFLAACASWGLSNEELFQRDDLIEATSETLARVAKTVIALVKFADSPMADPSRLLFGGGHKQGSTDDATSGGGINVSGPYKLGSVSRTASASSPNLVPQRPSQIKNPLASSASGVSSSSSSHATASSASASSPVSPSRTKRWSPSGLPTVRSDSPDEKPVTKDDVTYKSKPRDRDRDDHEVPGSIVADLKDIPRPLSPPPRSPLRTKTPKLQIPEDNGQGLFTRAHSRSTHSSTTPQSPTRSSVADSTRASYGDDSISESFGDHGRHLHHRPSRASSAMTDMTTSTSTTVMSSLLDVGRGISKFGTIRTITTEATSETPSITRTEGSSIADELGRKHKISDAAVVDLTRVVEETEESGSSSRGKSSRGKSSRGKSKEKESRKGNGKGKASEYEHEESSEDKAPIRLGKGKWPDDFIDALHPSPSISTSPKSPLQTQFPLEDRGSPSKLSSSPPRKLAIVGASRRSESVESLPQFPRRPTHRARHSIDTPSGGGSSLLPKESVGMNGLDGLPTTSNKVILRRGNSKSGVSRSGSLVPSSRNSGGDDLRDSDGEPRGVGVPFPRTVSADHSNSPSPRTASGDDLSEKEKVHRPPRGRFQSDVEGSKIRVRPSSYDELGGRPMRSRIESMVNLGGPSSHASASDLMNSRDSMEGSAVRKPLIIKEEGKLPTHFQLGNCIGRGQFGTVYRALNLNTGQMVAVKRIRLEGLKEEEVTQLMKEVDLVKRLSHPSIVKYEGMARDTDTLSIVLEYAENGSLGQTLKAFGKLNERLVASYVVRILEGLHYLHQSDVVHCDLKAANILTTKNGNVKLSDFGVSLNMRAMEREIKDVAGTPNWMAPEVIELKGASPKSDIWSLACTVIELLTGRPPYAEIPNSMTVMFRIVEDNMPPIPPNCSPLCEDFLKQCFNKNPSQRPNADLLCEHQWLKQNWGAHKELRPQDSIPFLRRVSADLQKSEAVRYLAQIEMPDRADEHISSSPPRAGRRTSNTSMRPSVDNEGPREHSFVKTTFSKPMVCRVCLLNVKKSAVLCAQCSLICHAKCADNAPPTCDLRAQLLLYAQYAEKGNPSSAYSNPVDLLNGDHPKSPMSDVPFVLHGTPRTSLDAPSTSLSPPPVAAPSGVVHPPTAFKFFKRGKAHSSQSDVSSSPPTETTGITRRLTKPRERPVSFQSTSTNQDSSLRSGKTASSSAGRRSTMSNDMGVIVESSTAQGISRAPSTSFMSDDAIPSRSIPGELTEEHRRNHNHKKNKSSGNCIVQ